MQDDVTLREVVPVWWLIVWRSVVGSLLIAGTLGFIAGVIGYFLLGPDVNSTVGFVLGALTGNNLACCRRTDGFEEALSEFSYHAGAALSVVHAATAICLGERGLCRIGETAADNTY